MERPREPPETFDEDFEAAEIERVFGPVDEKQQDVEQVTGLSESYLLKQFFILFILLFVIGFSLLHFSVLFRPNLPIFLVSANVRCWFKLSFCMSHKNDSSS